MDRDQRRLLHYLVLILAVALGGAGGGIAAGQDILRAVACFALAALAAIVADVLRPGRPSYR